MSDTANYNTAMAALLASPLCSLPLHLLSIFPPKAEQERPLAVGKLDNILESSLVSSRA